jgi:hypothetical protein
VAGGAIGGKAEKRFGEILNFYEGATGRKHVIRCVAFIASQIGMFALEVETGETVVEILRRGIPVNQPEIFPVMFEMAANTVSAVGIAHLKLRVIAELGSECVGNLLVTIETFESGSAGTKLVA